MSEKLQKVLACAGHGSRREMKPKSKLAASASMAKSPPLAIVLKWSLV
jgi:16S rRNA U516 pseudouridylate synthase RsuA-like enzyme